MGKPGAGATVTLADTEENQATYPQPSSQKPGLGFPICRVVGLFCLGSGEKLGARDHLITLTKPQKKPDWMSREDYDQAPQTLTVREFFAGGKVMVTTFLDPKQAPKS